ncbi:MAG: hypothetical protein JW943_06495 [Deltaproteobacteria bacterium]|nr:hypothetical protein [Deltaproteobacteria bacterium]
MKERNQYLRIILCAALVFFAASVSASAAMTVFMKDGRSVSVPVNKDDILSISFDDRPGAYPGASAAADVPVTVFWHMADDADVYLNGVPLRRYEPSFKTRGDEAPRPAFSAAARLKNGDVFTVGGRRGGSYGFMLIAVDQSGRVVFKTDQQKWRVYMPGDRYDWYEPAVAGASPKTPVTVQPNPWYPQKDLNSKYNNIAQSIWGAPSERFSYLTAVVALE